MAISRGTSPSVAATTVTKPMVGKWRSEGQVALIISLVGDRIVLSAPENKAWRIDLSDAQIEDQSVRYVQRHFLHSGGNHPFNGVACNTKIKLVDAQTMELMLTTDNSSQVESELLTRGE